MILYFCSRSKTKKNDFYYMKRFKNFSNIVPIIVGDGLKTKEEVKLIKAAFLKEAQEWNLEWFNFSEVSLLEFICLLLKGS